MEHDSICVPKSGLPVDRRVLDELARLGVHPVPPLHDVAKALGLADRTLQRHLHARGTSYRALVADAQREIALDRLRNTRDVLDTIAEECGFSCARALRRAVRRWVGVSPGEYRAQYGRAQARPSAVVLAMPSTATSAPASSDVELVEGFARPIVGVVNG
jgi:AraC-like DNA-binding protein